MIVLHILMRQTQMLLMMMMMKTLFKFKQTLINNVYKNLSRANVVYA